MLDKLEKIEEHYHDVKKELGEPDTLSQPQKLQALGKELSELEPIIQATERYRKVLSDIAGNEEIIASEPDPDLQQMARDELNSLKAQIDTAEQELKIMLVPKDPRDGKNVIIEVRAGTGGDEAALFAGELTRMYLKYADRRGWRTEILNQHETSAGGYKEIAIAIYGHGAYSRLKFESGTHRVQRVPETEANGRVHTSAATVAVMAEAEELDIVIRPEDLKIDVYRSSGHGGQSVNTTDSAVRITHLPTGTVVACQDERSQLKNKLKAMSILRSRVYAAEEERKDKERESERRSQVGTGDRSEKIRTYNYPQDRITDHRIHLNISNLPGFMGGDLDRAIDPLILASQAEHLSS